jgi:hypothetical protein
MDECSAAVETCFFCSGRMSGKFPVVDGVGPGRIVQA